MVHTGSTSNAADWVHLLQSHWKPQSPHCCGAPGLWKPAQLSHDMQLLHAQALKGGLRPHALTFLMKSALQGAP